MYLRLILLLLLIVAPPAVAVAETNALSPMQHAGNAEASTDRLIVRWKTTAASSAAKRPATLQKAGALAGVFLNRKRAMGGEMELLQMDSRKSGAELQRAITALADDPNVEWVAPDLRRKIQQLPTDPLIADQWYLLSTQPAAIHADQAWDTTTGSPGIVVAVLDTGVRFEHPDLLRAGQAGKLLPGYDFISGESASQFDVANDGNGRDADPSDPGDWINAGDKTKLEFKDCDITDSSWHGTRVAGLIGALTNNAVGVAGQAWNTWLLPVRVIGKCGGSDSDVLDAMRWAAGLSVPGVPANPYPARVLNMSFGADGACSAAYRSVIAEIAAQGTVVVVSAGNDGIAVTAPANCPGVIAVAGLRHAGSKVGYSNLGPEIALSAPAGNCVNASGGGTCLYSITALTNNGVTTPGTSAYTDQFNRNLGTSFSAPLVAGSAALMLSVNAKLTPALVKARLQEGATHPFPMINVPTPPATTAPPLCHVPNGDVQATECNCTADTCGAGMLNAAGAVNAAVRPIAAIQAPLNVNPGQPVTLDAAGSSAACGRTLATYAWAEAPNSPQHPTLSQSNGATTSVLAPATSEFVVRLTVTDNHGSTDSTDIHVSSTSTTGAMTSMATPACPVTITVAQTPMPAEPTPTSGKKKGGGVIELELIALAGLALARRYSGKFARRAA